MNLKNYYKVLRDTPQDLTDDVQFSMDILERIHELLELKFGGKQKLLAEKMGKSEAEISKLLSGVQNYTTRTLMKFQAAFGEPIIAVCTNSDDSTYVSVKPNNIILYQTLQVECGGELTETKIPFREYEMR